MRVKPDATTSGGYAALTFRVPNESDTASTTKLVLTLPRDKPLAHVSVTPVPGWTAKIVEAALPTPVTVQGTTLTKAARTITWTATPGTAIGPGQYQEFSISAGPLPAPGAFVLPVAQRYSDGKVVSWDQPQTKGALAPEHPAPQFDITPAETDKASATVTSNTASASRGQGSEPDRTGVVLAGGALTVSLLGVGGQLVGARRRRAGSA